MDIENSSFYIIYKSSASPGFEKADHSHLIYCMLKWQLGHLNGHNLDHHVQASYFSVSNVALSYAVNMVILMICMTYACSLHNSVI
jgi:hypothetical protein